ncbi:MAG: hypothetical protein J6K32_03520 [Clostridia bacterium]|nr:hypothetical protein [Clostridia bacterium]
MNKKMILIAGTILALILAAGVCALAMGGTVVESVPEEIHGLSGVIVDVGSGAVVFEDAQHGMVQANLTDSTVFEGVDAGELEVGGYIFVDYDGKMTRSLPAQVTALRVYVHMIAGEVTQVDGGSVTIVKDETGEEIVVHLPEDAGMIAVGDHVTAATNGAMTMSLPPQVSAVQIAVDAQ